MDAHANAVGRAQSGERFRSNSLIRLQLEIKTLGESCEHEGRFHQCKSLPDAAALAASEWKVGKGREPGDESVEPSLRLERERLGKIARVAMHDPGRHQDCRSGGQGVAAQLDGLLRGTAAEDKGRRIQAK